MKYLGNKTRLINFIESALLDYGVDVYEKDILDLCAGTGAVSKYFKSKKCTIDSVDIMNYSKMELYRTLYFNDEPNFIELHEDNIDGTLESVLNYLNNLDGYEGYYFNEYAPSGLAGRRYFSDDNAKKIDGIMDQLAKWKEILPEEKYNFLMGVCINEFDRVANIAGTYGAYLKIWRSMALKKIKLSKPEFVNSGHINIVCEDLNVFLKTNNKFYDIVYMDPPYNSRQYAPNFHVLENMANNDRPILQGVTGQIDYSNKKSDFCYKNNALNQLDYVCSKLNTKVFVLSYSTEGLMATSEIEKVLLKYFRVHVVKQEYRRFKTNSNTKTNTGLKELLYICTK